MIAPEVSIIIPVYNEEEGLPALFARLYPALDALGHSYEVIFINDGSRDRSAALLRDQFQQRPEVTRVILLNGNFGQHMAIMAGFERSRGQRIVTLDADLQNPPEDIIKLVAKMDEGYDYIGSIRRLRQDSWWRRKASLAMNWLRERITKVKMTDQGCMLRAYDRAIIDAINQSQEVNTFTALQRVEERGAVETADRVLMLARQVWEYWLPTATNQDRNITEGLKARLMPYRGKGFAAILEPLRFGELMRAIRAYKGGPLVRTALQLAPLLYQRPGNLRMMEWAELDLDGALWTIPSMKMKREKHEKEQGEAHAVPMPTQAVALIRALHPLTGHGQYVFPGERSHDRPISDNSVRSALYALGFGKEQTWHGFRSSARTMMVDELDMNPLAIEANLAHAVKDANGRSYNRTQYLKQRFEQIQQWADYLDRLAAGAVVIPLRTAA